ncbi:hypothetical protein QP414_05405 [Corynebacterium simulans]|uniref:Uncharacterized protein n=1 Tax=Corynebacterium accolens TaxID=38284 RepID=A0A2A4AHN4_9CORY|nr:MULTISPECIES: hypothetical protein [Corynebacterium]MCG7247742.1 hypothetical protein [Corynebacterium simulans]MCK6159961.1 hypothetical protein [Corynebacterium simulans]MDK7138744.1 hypothetical protein [Corynebacterium simulans]PCC83275.1 hypothetical protein COM45_05415 [Corynebacterium accolens]
MLNEYSRGEQITGLAWLCLGALTSLVLEVVYLTARLPLPGGTSVAFPITIVLAWWFNTVLTRTARLWSDNAYIGLVPLAAWLLGYFAFVLGAVVTGDMWLANNILSLLLLIAGIGGGIFPFFAQK